MQAGGRRFDPDWLHFVPGGLTAPGTPQPVGLVGLAAGRGSVIRIFLDREALAVTPDSPCAAAVARMAVEPPKKGEERRVAV